MVFNSIITTVGELLKTWVYTFTVSFTNHETIWIIIPIWLSWFFAEFFQEKQGTSFGNAISNGVIPLWVGIDWLRLLTNRLIASHIKFDLLVFSEYIISILILSYGLLIIIGGIRGKHLVHYMGRMRVVTYILAVFTPFIYGLVVPSFFYLVSIIIFFPLYYFIIELVDRVTPKPKIYDEDTQTYKSYAPKPTHTYPKTLHKQLYQPKPKFVPIKSRYR